MFSKKITSKSLKYFLFSIILIISAFFIYTGIRSINFANQKEARSLSQNEISFLENTLANNWKEKNQIVQKLPYNIKMPEPQVGAESVILIDFSNGNILYEKNADQVIPPASMTKLFAMYVVDQAVSEGKVSYEQIIPLPPESWACNMPPRSSLMFLGKGQIVTLEELLLGLSISSGNDAAYALAYTICGSMEEFVKKMNQVAIDLGLENTYFVESSGYSELNTTTAREMAIFSKIYLQKHPDSIKKFHSQKSFTYPKEHNMAPTDVYGPQDWSNGLTESITMGITQKNTNPLLGLLEGCDGLKTGYIDESGYNLSLTAQRDGRRYISITMKGPGNSTKEGQANRIKDGTELMEYAFNNFAPFYSKKFNESYLVKCFGSKEMTVNLIPAYQVTSVSVPFITGNSLEENMQNVHVELDLPKKLAGKVYACNQYGSIQVKLEDYTLESIPLVADRSTSPGNFITKMADTIISLFY